jgi:hypothetical protein
MTNDKNTPTHIKTTKHVKTRRVDPKATEIVKLYKRHYQHHKLKNQQHQPGTHICRKAQRLERRPQSTLSFCVPEYFKAHAGPMSHVTKRNKIYQEWSSQCRMSYLHINVLGRCKQRWLHDFKAHAGPMSHVAYMSPTRYLYTCRLVGEPRMIEIRVPEFSDNTQL